MQHLRITVEQIENASLGSLFKPVFSLKSHSLLKPLHFLSWKHFETIAYLFCSCLCVFINHLKKVKRVPYQVCFISKFNKNSISDYNYNKRHLYLYFLSRSKLLFCYIAYMYFLVWLYFHNVHFQTDMILINLKFYLLNVKVLISMLEHARPIAFSCSSLACTFYGCYSFSGLCCPMTGCLTPTTINFSTTNVIVSVGDNITVKPVISSFETTKTIYVFTTQQFTLSPYSA